MKVKLIKWLAFFLVLTTSTFLSCSSDDEAPAKKFTAGEITLDLKNANLFLTETGYVDEGTEFSRVYSDYAITDGTAFLGGSGWNVNDFEDATWLIVVEIGTGINETEFVAGDFLNYNNWLTEIESPIGYLYASFEDGECYPFYPLEEEVGHPIKVSGGFDDGDKMTIRYKGGFLKYVYWDDVNEVQVQESVATDLHFSGIVQDARIVSR
jgi:hypothetical protein